MGRLEGSTLLHRSMYHLHGEPVRVTLWNGLVCDTAKRYSDLGHKLLMSFVACAVYSSVNLVRVTLCIDVHLP